MHIIKDSLSYRLNQALGELSVSQSELARKIGAKPQAIQYICSHNVQKSRYTYDMAKALDLSYEWLATGMGSMIYENTLQAEDITSYKTPILDDEQLADFVAYGFDIMRLRTSEFALTHQEIPFSTFAYKIHDQAMEPIFNRQSLVFIDYQRSSEHGDYVLAYVKSVDQYLVRKLYRNDGTFKLQPCHDTLFKDIVLTKDDAIIGPVVQALQTYS